jgi:hypothetical protein
MKQEDSLTASSFISSAWGTPMYGTWYRFYNGGLYIVLKTIFHLPRLKMALAESNAILEGDGGFNIDTLYF